MQDLKSDISDFRERIEALGRKAAENEARALREHETRMATLPVGTCGRCYGLRVVERYGINEPCPECDPPIQHASGVPYEFRSARLSDYEELAGNKAALQKARAFLDSTGRDLYLFGGVGAGKTRLACSMLNEHFLRRRVALFVRVPMALYELQPGRHADDIAQLERRLIHTDLLVLDDIGAERDQATDFTRRTLLMLYEARGDQGLRTIWTSNKSLDELAAMQDDDRLASRIAGRADVVKLTTSDQRMARRA